MDQHVENKRMNGQQSVGCCADLFGLLSFGLQALLFSESARAFGSQVELKLLHALLQVAPSLLARGHLRAKRIALLAQ
jgi:hypothetical protein